MDISEKIKETQLLVERVYEITESFDLQHKKILACLTSHEKRLSKHETCLSAVSKQTKEASQFMEKLLETNQNVEETLLNVLLAIKQNEYLQAWYPEQSGFPEQKVIGKHPSKIRSLKNGT